MNKKTNELLYRTANNIEYYKRCLKDPDFNYDNTLLILINEIGAFRGIFYTLNDRDQSNLYKIKQYLNILQEKDLFDRDLFWKDSTKWQKKIKEEIDIEKTHND